MFFNINILTEMLKNVSSETRSIFMKGKKTFLSIMYVCMYEFGSWCFVE